MRFRTLARPLPRNAHRFLRPTYTATARPPCNTDSIPKPTYRKTHQTDLLKPSAIVSLRFLVS